MENILKEKIFLYKQGQQKMDYNLSDYANLWSLVKIIFEGKLLIKEARKQQNVIEKKITELHHRLNYSGPGKGMKPSTKKTLEDLHSDAENLYTIRENIINEMFNTKDEKLDIATGDNDKRVSVIEAV